MQYEFDVYESAPINWADDYEAREPAIESLDDLDEQQQMQIAAAIERFGESHRLTKRMNTWMDAYYERREPECECRFAGDQADASGCDLHNPPARRPMTRIVPCVQCKAHPARFDSLYCSDACKQALYAEIREAV